MTPITNGLDDKIKDHCFQTKAEAEGAWNSYGSELAADISYCGICNRPYEEHALTATADLKQAIAEAKRQRTQKTMDDLIRIQAAAITAPAMQLDEQGHLILKDEEIERVAQRVIEILGREMSKWLNLLQSNFPKV